MRRIPAERFRRLGRHELRRTARNLRRFVGLAHGARRYQRQGRTDAMSFPARCALGLAVLAQSLAIGAGVAAAGQRYASPTGTMVAPCTSASPCDLATAVQNAADNDEVIVNPGAY